MTDILKGYIYIMRNKLNNKKYIGQTIQKPDIRIQQHFTEAYDQNRRTYNTCLNRAIRKYGVDTFEWAILADNIEDNDKLDLLEEYFIDIYNSKSPNGYNMTSGGVNTDGNIDFDNNDDYSDNTKVVLDEISDDDVERILRELG